MGLLAPTLVVTAATPDAARKLDRALQLLTALPRSQIRGLLDQGCVTVNGAPCSQPWQRLAIGDRVAVRYDPSRRYHPRSAPPRDLGFAIQFEDEHLIVVEKPAGWLTVPTAKREPHTLIQRVGEYLSSDRRRVRVQAVQRLDRGVSGILVFAKTRAAAAGLRQQFQQHEPERRYLAIVAGRVVADAGTFRSRLVTTSALRRRSSPAAGVGELAITHYRVERRFADTTLVGVWLETGRRHQIRVHFAEAGHPILGDDTYGAQRAPRSAWTARRLALHAGVLAFLHPVTGASCRYETPPPSEFATILGRAR